MNVNSYVGYDRVLLAHVPGLLGAVVVDGHVLFAQVPQAGCQVDFASWTARGIAHSLGVALHEVVLRKDELPARCGYNQLAVIASEKAREERVSAVAKRASSATVPRNGRAARCPDV